MVCWSNWLFPSDPAASYTLSRYHYIRHHSKYCNFNSVRLEGERRKIMSKAQKRTWFVFVISAATLLISALALWSAWVNQIILIDIENPMRIRLLGLTNAIPLILFFIIVSFYRKRDFDERDKAIYRKSSGIGYITGLTFIVAAGFFLFCIVEPLGATTNIYIWMRFTYLVYLALFVSFLTSSIAALIQYGRIGKGEKL
jgi:hypothetical protein